jgi:hypothetical protein
MYEIYRYAFKVVVCLTTHEVAQTAATCDGDRAVECIKQVYRDVSFLDKSLASSGDSSQKTCDVWDGKETAECQLNSYLQRAVKEKDFALGWLDVLRMLRMPWFSRAWVS